MDDDFFRRHHRASRSSHQSPPPQLPPNHPHQDLQSLLKEMKDLNYKVQENSNVLQKGIENIAIELQEDSNKSNRGTLRMPSKQEEDGEIEQSKHERSFYRSEAETLRLEMKDIKEQLNEIRKILPQKGISFEWAPPANPVEPTGSDEDSSIETGIPNPYPETSIRNRSNNNSSSTTTTTTNNNINKNTEPRSSRFLETIDYPPLNNSERSARSILGSTAMKNAAAIIQQHHHHIQPVPTNNKQRSALSKAEAPSPISRRRGRRSLGPLSRNQNRDFDSMEENRRSDNKKELDAGEQQRDPILKSTETQSKCDILSADKDYRRLRRSLRQRYAADSLHHKQNPSRGGVDEEYLAELRKSWHKRRGLSMNPSSTSNDNSSDTISAESPIPENYNRLCSLGEF